MWCTIRGNGVSFTGRRLAVLDDVTFTISRYPTIIFVPFFFFFWLMRSFSTEVLEFGNGIEHDIRPRMHLAILFIVSQATTLASTSLQTDNGQRTTQTQLRLIPNDRGGINLLFRLRQIAYTPRRFATQFLFLFVFYCSDGQNENIHTQYLLDESPGWVIKRRPAWTLAWKIGITWERFVSNGVTHSLCRSVALISRLASVRYTPLHDVMNDSYENDNGHSH